MEYIWKDLLTDRWWSWLALVVSVVLTAVLFTNSYLLPWQKTALAIGAYLALCVFFLRPVVDAAYAGHTHLVTVCLWTFVLVLLGVIVTYYSFYTYFGANQTKYDKVLNVVPVLVAIWAAAVGWFVHFRVSTKAHRSSNTFAIVMETRRSAEYIKKAEIVGKHFPAEVDEVPSSYKPYFGNDSLIRYLDACRAENREPEPLVLENIDAIRALKYVLNYYEFMAVGIRIKDLDEDLIYDTMSVSVVRIYTRSKPLVKHLREKMGQTLAFVDLEALSKRWEARLAQHKADFATGKIKY